MGRRFYDQIERLILQIRREPGRFRLWDPPLRRHFSGVFPYAVLYVDQPDRVLIIAVMHLERRPGTGSSAFPVDRPPPPQPTFGFRFDAGRVGFRV